MSFAMASTAQASTTTGMRRIPRGRLRPRAPPCRRNARCPRRRGGGRACRREVTVTGHPLLCHPLPPTCISFVSHLPPPRRQGHRKGTALEEVPEGRVRACVRLAYACPSSCPRCYLRMCLPWRRRLTKPPAREVRPRAAMSCPRMPASSPVWGMTALAPLGWTVM